MANPAKIAVRSLVANGVLALPAADTIDTTGVVPILAADLRGATDRLFLEVEGTSSPQSVTILHGDNPPAVRERLGDLVIPVDAVQASLETALAGDDNDLVFTAVNGGVGGNAITVKYTNPGGAGALSVAVVGTAIDVTLAHDGAAITSTAEDVAGEIAATPAAAALVTVANAAGNDGTGLVTAMAATNLAGGAAAPRRLIGPFEGARFLQDDGTLQLSFVVVAGQTLSVRCYQLPKNA